MEQAIRQNAGLIVDQLLVTPDEDVDPDGGAEGVALSDDGDGEEPKARAKR